MSNEKNTESKLWYGGILLIMSILIALVVAGFKLEMNANIIHLKESDYECTMGKSSNARDGCSIYEYIGDKQ